MSLRDLVNELAREGRIPELIVELLRNDSSRSELCRYVSSDCSMVMRPIGIVRHSFDDEYVRSSMSGVDGVVEIFDEFVDGLDGIDGFSHILLISFLNKAGYTTLKVKPRRLLLFGLSESELPEVGVFSTDSPRRPNPIGLSIVRLVKRDGGSLYVSNLDLYNGTPILDIKPYTPDRRVDIASLPQWYVRLKERVSGPI